MSTIYNFKLEPSELMGKIIAVVGAPGSGKTTIILDIMYALREITTLMGVCPTDEIQGGIYSKHVPPILVHNYVALDKIEKFMGALNTKATLKSSHTEEYPEFRDVSTVGLLLMDDVGSQNEWKQSEIFRKVVMDGRHGGRTIVIGVQNYKHLPHDLRPHIDLLFVRGLNNTVERNKIFEEFGSQIFQDKKKMNKVFDECYRRNKHATVVLDLKAAGKQNMSEKVFYYVAENRVHQDFKMGHELLWMISDKLYDPEYKIRMLDLPNALGERVSSERDDFVNDKPKGVYLAL